MASGMRNWLEFKKRRVIRDKLLGFLLQSAYALVATGAAVTLVFGATLFIWMGSATVALSVVGLQFVLYPIFGKRLRYSASDGVFKVVLGLLFIPSSLAESAIGGGIGARLDAGLPARWDAALFGETQSRIVVSLSPRELPRLEKLAREGKTPMAGIGSVGGDQLVFGGVSVALAAATDAWENGFERATSG